MPIPILQSLEHYARRTNIRLPLSSQNQFAKPGGRGEVILTPECDDLGSVTTLVAHGGELVQIEALDGYSLLQEAVSANLKLARAYIAC